MKKVLLLSVFAASVLAAGCETTQTSAAAAKGDEGDVMTGSRIPRKGGSSDGAVQTTGREGYKQGQIERSSGGVMGQ